MASRGEVLKRLQDLKQEVSLFLKDKKCPLSEKFESKSFLYIQGPGVTIMDAAEKLNAFLLKLSLWECRLEVCNYANFPMLEDLILKDETQKQSDIFISMRKEFCLHLDTLQTSFKGYFNLDSFGGEAWIRNPFLVDLNSIDDEDHNKDDLFDLRARELLHIEFNTISLEKLWCSQQHSYQSLAKQAISTLIPFATI